MKWLRLGVFVGAFILITLFLSGSSFAATFTVDSTGDGGNTGGPGVCDDGTGDCTLRAAIEAANATAGADTINFGIAGAGVQTITPGSNYPAITEQLTINGESQSGSSCGNLVPASLPAASNTPHVLLIDIDGSSIGNIITIDSDNITVRGLVLRGAGSNIYSSPAGTISDILIECNYIGTNVAGTSSSGSTTGINLTNNADYIVRNNLVSGNTGSGFASYQSNGSILDNLIGTTASGTSALGNGGGGIYTTSSDPMTVSHNVASGNTYHGIYSSLVTNLTVTGNYTGLGINGGVISNSGDGINILGGNNMTIGGTSASLRNVSSGNGGDGLHVYNNCSGSGVSQNALIYGNYLGVNTSGTTQASYGNGGSGLEVNEYYGGCVSVYKYQIGGDAAGQPNTIAGNSADGIRVHQQALYDVFSITTINNTIYGNGNLGINLAADTDNDNGIADTDLGPNPLNALTINYPTSVANYYLNHPVINSTQVSGNNISINYSFQAPSVTENWPNLLASNLIGFRLDFYLNDGQDGAYTGYNQGKTHLGSFIVNGSETNATHTFTSPIPITNGKTINATATVLWQIIGVCDGTQQGDGPPYGYCGPT